jgi:hypothetical protein
LLSWSGVVKGAVLRGVGIGMDVAPDVRSCPRHYAICVNELYAGWRHKEEQAVTDHVLGKQIVPQQLIWLIRKGDVILPDAPIVSSYVVENRFTSKQRDSRVSLRITFAASAIENPPSNLSDLRRGTARPFYIFLQSALRSLCALCPITVIY